MNFFVNLSKLILRHNHFYMKNSKKTQRNWIITSIVIISVLIVSFIVYSIKTDDVDSDTPPTLSLEGTTYKGIMTDLGGYLQYEAGDTCEHDVSLSHILKGESKTALYYATEDLSIQDIVDRINCVPYNKILIAYWDPAEKIMYTYPEGPYLDTVLITDLNFTIPALHSFIIISKEETLIEGINNENEPVEHEIQQSGDNIFDVGSLYGFVNDITSGWVLIPGISNGGYLIEYLNESDLVDRVEKIYAQTGEYDFAPVTKDNGDFDNISFNNGYYMIWMKIAEAPMIIGPIIVEPIIVEQIATLTGDCGGADATHVCMTDDGSEHNNYLPDDPTEGRGMIEFTSGDEACSSVLGTSCIDIEANCEDFINSTGLTSTGYAGGWDNDFTVESAVDMSNVGCSDIFDVPSYPACLWRAVCEPIIVEPAIPAGECGGAGETHACVTDGSDSAVLIQTGDDACWDIQQYCAGLEVSCHNIEGEPPEPDWNNSSATCTDTSFSTICVYRAACYTMQ